MRSLKIDHQITDRRFESLNKYFTEIAKINLITSEEEVLLAKRIKNGDQLALDRLVKANLRFVVSVCKQYQKGNQLSIGDLINEGNLGLIRAAKRFDETKGFKFISYAVWWIRQAIMEAISQKNRLVRIPLNRVGEINQIYNATLTLEQKLHREPTVAEISEIVKISAADIQNNLAASKYHLSLDSPIGHVDNTLSLSDIIPDTNHLPESKLIKNSIDENIQRVLSKLSSKQKLVIEMYYGLNGNDSMSLGAIGEVLDLSNERVRQIKKKALFDMKMKSKNGKNFNY